jgi:hypothetical protein
VIIHMRVRGASCKPVITRALVLNLLACSKEQVEIVASPAPAARSPSAGARRGASSSFSRTGGAAGRTGSALGAAARSPALHTAEVAPDTAGRKQKAPYASGMFSPPGKAAPGVDKKNQAGVEF